MRKPLLWRLKRHLRHPTELTLQRLQAGVLTPRELAFGKLSSREETHIQQHVDGCLECQGLLASYAQLDQVLQTVAQARHEQPLPDAFQVQLLSTVLEAQRLQRVAAVQPVHAPDRLTTGVWSLIALGLAGGLVAWSSLKRFDTVSVELAESLRRLVVLQRAMESFLLMAADYSAYFKAPTLITAALAVILLSWMAKRRTHFLMAL